MPLQGKRYGALLLCLFLLTVLPWEVRGAGVPPPPNSQMIWSNESLRQIFIQMQYRFIGIVPGNYTEPRETDIATMNSVFSLVESGIYDNRPDSMAAAASLASSDDYRLLAVNDTATGHKFIVLTENQNVNRGWGSYFFVAEPSRGTRVIVEAPHPVTDFNSQNIAYEIFTEAYPLVNGFFVSGVERTFGSGGGTDMAHKSLSIFETATEACAIPESIVIQIHGFDSSRHPTYPLVVLSTGDGGTNGALESTAANLRASGLTVGVFDGFRYEKLGGQGNVQGRYVRSILGGFVHMEISSTAVFNSTLVEKVQTAVVQSIRSGFRFSGFEIDPTIPAVVFSVFGVFLLAGSRLGQGRVASNPKRESVQP